MKFIRSMPPPLQAKKSTLVLHIGGPKCGSSSLQTFLTQNSTLKTFTEEKIEYWRIQPNTIKEKGFIFTPISKIKLSEGIKYESSDKFYEALNENCLHSIFEKFVSDNSQHEQKIFVFSREAWSNEFQNAKIVKCKCEEKDFTILIYLSVRPQTDILIPSYLQWTIFSETPSIERTLDLLKEFSDWSRQIENAVVLGADKISAKYTSDIVEDFCNELNIDRNTINYKPLKDINRSIPVEIISLMMNNRELRPGPHASEMDFLIEDYLDKFNIETKKLVLKVDASLVSDLEEYFMESNFKLEKFLDSFNAIAYKKRLVESRNHLLENYGISDLTQIEIDPKFLENFLVALLKYSLELIQERDDALRKFEVCLDSITAQRDEFLESKSWRITSPLRALMRLAKWTQTGSNHRPFDTGSN
jgi:hypothetical protein